MPLQKILLRKALKKLHRRERSKFESPLSSPTSILAFNDNGKLNSVYDDEYDDGPLHRSSESLSVPSDVREGFFPVYVGEESKRYVIPLKYLNHHVFVALLNRAEEEFGFSNSGLIRLPCETALFEHLLWLLNRDDPSLQSL